MLKLCRAASVDQKLEAFSQMDPAKQTWLVSDLRSKLHLQQLLLQKYDFLHDTSIMRANELWQFLVNILVPEINIVSADFAKTLIRSELKNSEEEWQKRPGVVDVVYSYLESLIPLLAHSRGNEFLKEWFERNDEAKWKWHHWYELSQKTWETFLQRNFLTSTWLSGVLSNAENLSNVWKKELLVDLGVHVSAVEIEVLLKLSEKNSVTIFLPEEKWLEDFPSLFDVYKPLLEASSANVTTLQAGKTAADEQSVSSDRQFLKFTTMISEVKHATAVIRQWLDKGVPAERIALTAPVVEAYWPSLKMYFAKEGIPVSKKSVARCHAFPGMMRWLSDLRLQVGAVKYSDLQSRFFAERKKSSLAFADFERLFVSVYGKEDLKRHAEVAKYFSQDISAEEHLPLREFIAWALKHWPSEYLGEKQRLPLETLCHKLFQDAAGAVELEASDWLAYIESVASRLELEVEPAVTSGVQIVQIFSAEYVDCDCLVFLGLTDQAVRPSARNGLSASDANSLHRDTGFRLNSIDSQQLEFDCRWLLERPFKNLVASFPATDFAGDAQAPALLWLLEKMRTSEEFESVVSPSACRWDEIQQAVTQSSEKWLHSAEEITEQLKVENGLLPLKSFENGLPKRMSATALEQYLSCPFKFAASRLFKLSDLPALDLDVDRMTRGSLMHALFESLLKAEKGLNFTDEEIITAIEKARETEDVKVADERLWPSLKGRYLHLARQFLDFEKEWRSKFPQTKTVGLEEKIQGFINLQTGELEKSLTQDIESIEFSGSIDRVDVGSDGQAVIIDYKSSKGSLRQYGSWVKANQLQLGMYAQAVEKGLTNIGEPAVSSAVYYIGKGCDRSVGFRMSEFAGELYPGDGSKASIIDEDGKKQLFADLNEAVKETLNQIRQGNFHPDPKNQTACDTCRWRSVCRAPHLS